MMMCNYSVDWNRLRNLRKISRFYNLSTGDFTVHRITYIKLHLKVVYVYMCVYYVYVYMYIWYVYNFKSQTTLFRLQKRKLIQMKTKEDRFVLAPSLPMIKFCKEEGSQGFPLPSCFSASSSSLETSPDNTAIASPLSCPKQMFSEHIFPSVGWIHSFPTRLSFNAYLREDVEVAWSKDTGDTEREFNCCFWTKLLNWKSFELAKRLKET